MYWSRVSLAAPQSYHTWYHTLGTTRNNNLLLGAPVSRHQAFHNTISMIFHWFFLSLIGICLIGCSGFVFTVEKNEDHSEDQLKHPIYSEYKENLSSQES